LKNTQNVLFNKVYVSECCGTNHAVPMFTNSNVYTSAQCRCNKSNY